MALQGRTVLAVLLVLLGLTLSIFYWLLFAIADCSTECVERGERAIPIGLVGLGLGIAGGGAALWRMPARSAAGWGIAFAGLVTAIGCILLFAEGAKGMAYWVFAAGLVAVFVGSMLRRQSRPFVG